MVQMLGDNHHPPTVGSAVRHLRLRLRLRSHSECAALAAETSEVRADLRLKGDTWEDALDEARAVTTEVGYKDQPFQGHPRRRGEPCSPRDSRPT